MLYLATLYLENTNTDEEHRLTFMIIRSSNSWLSLRRSDKNDQLDSAKNQPAQLTGKMNRGEFAEPLDGKLGKLLGRITLYLREGTVPRNKASPSVSPQLRKDLGRTLANLAKRNAIGRIMRRSQAENRDWRRGSLAFNVTQKKKLRVRNPREMLVSERIRACLLPTKTV